MLKSVVIFVMVVQVYNYTGYPYDTGAGDNTNEGMADYMYEPLRTGRSSSVAALKKLCPSWWTVVSCRNYMRVR